MLPNDNHSGMHEWDLSGRGRGNLNNNETSPELQYTTFELMSMSIPRTKFCLDDLNAKSTFVKDLDLNLISVFVANTYSMSDPKNKTKIFD